eukprot:g8244.t1
MSDKGVGRCGGGGFGRLVKLSIGVGRNKAGGGIIPTDPGDGMDDGAKFRDLVWVPDDEKVWRAVKKAPGKDCGSPRKRSPRSPTSDGVWVHMPGQSVSIEVPKDRTHAYDPSHALDLDDVSKMNQMHEAPLLDLLLRRFRKDAIYTNVADVLISINPYKNIPLLYEVPRQQMQDEPEDEFEDSDEEKEELFVGGESGGRRGSGIRDPRPKALRNKLAKPHVFSVADRAFRYMKCPDAEYSHGKARCRNQSIIISGESGAGKTEASKHVMRYLITASQLATGELAHSAGGGDGSSLGAATAKIFEATLLRSNTLLEAFGNAKTLRNDNSSRFGKYIKLLYDSDYRLMGASTDHFLLEKSRLVKVDSGERCYHIFYQLLVGLGKSRAEGLFLGPPEDFHMISQGGCITVSDEVDDAQEFSQTDDAMGTLGFTVDDKEGVFRVLAALLHLGNVRFEETHPAGQEEGGAKARVSSWTSDGSSSAESSGTSAAAVAGGGGGTCLEKAAGLLGLDADALAKKIIFRAIMTPSNSLHEIALTARESSDNLSALSKHTYGKLFAWVVGFVNRCHRRHVHDLHNAGAGATARGTASAGEGDDDRQCTFIGILDIFGFEIMATNSFEQLCINFANEVLQRQFNNHIFVLEQEEYKVEGLDVAMIPFTNNEAVIDLISKKPLGLMIILEDQVLTGRKAHAMNKLDDRSVLDLYHQEHHRRNPHPNYEKPRMQCDQFIVKHFAGSVTYDVAGFLEKNNDSLQDDLRALLLDSKDPFIRELAGADLAAEETAQRLGPSPSAPPARGASLPPPPPRGGSGLVPSLGRSPSFSPQRRVSRRGSERGGGLANATTVSSLFRRQLDSLVAQLGRTEPHYIKCIKPNSAKSPGGWSSPLVIDQLRYSGVLEVVRIRREAYPLRLAYAELYRRFRFLAGWKSGGTPAPERCSYEQARELCGEICRSALEPEDFQLGSTRAFLKDDAIDRLRWALHAKYVSAACGIQARWRAYAEEARRARAHNAALSLQAAARGFVSRRRCGRIRAARTMQAASRGFVARRRYSRVLQEKERLRAREAELRVRRAEREAEETRQRQTAAQTLMASAARGFIERKRRQKEISASTVLQAGWRGWNARKVLESSRAARRSLERRRATELQAWARMMLAGQARTRARRASTTLASAWRMRAAVTSKKQAVANVIKLQALVRGMLARRRYSLSRGRIVRIQTFIRGSVKRSIFVRQVHAAWRLQECVRAWQRNNDLRKRVVGIFGAARRGDVHEVTRHVTEFPQLLFVRDRYGRCGANAEESGLPDGVGGDPPQPRPSPRCFATLLHAACESGAMDVVVLLEPFPDDVTAKDLNGDSSVHVAASAVDYELVKYLARRNNMDVEKALKQEKERCEHAEHLSRKQVSSSVNVFRATRLERARWAKKCVDASAATRARNIQGASFLKGKNALMSGYLRKRRETDRWLKRWCVLTETSLMYFHKPTDESPSKIIKLDKAMLKKSEKVDFAFEIHTPDLLDKKNKEGRLHFACAEEGELQRWLVPLRVVVALYQFRNDKRREPLVYLDAGRREQLASMRNKSGETPLHALARANLVNFAEMEPRKRPLGATGLATLSGRTSVVSMQRLAAWLIESGADPNAVDDSGQTALHVAMECDNFAVVSTLARKGGDVNLKRRVDGRTVITLALEQGQGMDIIEQVSSERVTANHTLLPPPEKLFGFTYVSFFIEKTTFPASKHNAVIELTTPSPNVAALTGSFNFEAADGSSMRGTLNRSLNKRSAVSRWGHKLGHAKGGGPEAPGGAAAGAGGDGDHEQPPALGTLTIDRVVEQLFFVRVSVYNSKGKLSEPQQDVTVPIMTSPEYLWWAHTWHMQTPLETLGAGSFVAFELKEKGERKERTISWGAYHLNPDEINTRPESLCAYAGVPPALVPLEPSEFSLVGEAIISKVTSSFSSTPTSAAAAATATTATATATAATATATAAAAAAADTSMTAVENKLGLSASSSLATANNAG